MQKSKIGNTNALKHGCYSKSLLRGEAALKFDGGLDSEILLARIMLRRIVCAEALYNTNLAKVARQNTPKGKTPVRPVYDPRYAELTIRYLRQIGRLVEIKDSLGSASVGVDSIAADIRAFGAAAFATIPKPKELAEAAEDDLAKEMREFAAQAFKTIPKPKEVPEYLK